MTDGKRVYDDGKMFLRKLQRFLNKQADLSSGQKNFKRITIAEPHRQEKHRGAMYHKSDSDDAEASDKVKNIDYQDARDMVTLSIVSDLQHYESQLAEVDKMLEKMYKMLGCTLTTIPGVNVITAVKILAEIGDIKRFSNANKLAHFAGIAPLHLSSSGKGKDVATKQGNRRLQATIYFLAIQMVQVSSKGTPRNPVVRAYYEKRKAEGKTSQQALICISRRLISVIYGMLKNGTEYRMPVVENAGENR